jgi:PAS domain S-box-containing protein
MSSSFQEPQALEEQFRLVVDTTPALLQSALPDGSHDYFNKRWLNYLGASLEEIKGWSWTTRIHPEDLDGFVAKWRSCLANGGTLEAEARVRRADGAYRWLLHRCVPLRDGQGKIIRWFGSSIDIEDRKRAEEDLRMSKTLLAEAQRLSHTGSFGWNVTTDEHFWSDETFRIFEYDSSTRIELKLILERIHPEDIPLFQRVVAGAAEGRDFDFQCRLLAPGGCVKHVHIVARAVRNELGNIEFIGAVMDVTAAKRAEESLQEARGQLARVTRVTMMGELAASIAHEVNQPMAGVVTSASAGLNWLANTPPNLPKARESIERILRDANRAGAVLTRIRTFLKRSPLSKSRVSVTQIVRDVVILADDELRQNNIELSAELDPGLPAIMGDSVQLQQVLLNFIMNAVEAMAGVSERRRTLRIQTGPDNLGGSPAVFVKVSDNGIGFTTTDTGRLFEAFYTTKPKGMGMGLWISRSIVEGHGGRLTAQANDGPGATFQILLPADTGDAG